MAWTRFTAVSDKPTIGTGVSVSLRKSKAGPAKMTFNLRAEQVEGFGWADGDKLEVMLGEGEHHGLVRLRKNNSAAGSVELSRRSGARDSIFYVARLGHVPGYVDRSEPKRWMQFESVEDGWVEFVLPLWADETAPRASKAAPPPHAHSCRREFPAAKAQYHRQHHGRPAAGPLGTGRQGLGGAVG